LIGGFSKTLFRRKKKTQSIREQKNRGKGIPLLGGTSGKLGERDRERFAPGGKSARGGDRSMTHSGGKRRRNPLGEGGKRKKGTGPWEAPKEREGDLCPFFVGGGFSSFCVKRKNSHFVCQRGKKRKDGVLFKIENQKRETFAFPKRESVESVTHQGGKGGFFLGAALAKGNVGPSIT